MRINSLLLLFAALFMYTSCSDTSDDIQPQLSANNEILTFMLEKSKNEPFLEEDITATISDNEINLTIPEELSAEKLIATFTHNAETVTVGYTLQESGVTTNDFSKKIVYTVEAEDKTKNHYTVKVEWLEENVVEISSFILEKSNNESYLKKDIVGTIVENEINLTLPQKLSGEMLIATFIHNGKEILVGTTPQESGVTANDFSQELVYTLGAKYNVKKDYTLKVEWQEARIPHIYINTDNGTPIVEKKVYIDTDIRIDGGDQYEDFEARGKIRGRGNSTWGMAKKPYRFKLDSKASLFGLSAEKDWVLLQNYIDPSLMGNSVAMKIGQLLEMPFTHHMIPVDVTLNGEYIGSYTFTEHKEVEENRINVGDGGWLFELDTYFDEDYKFKSTNYKLPVMIQHPELDKLADAEAMVIKNEMENDFNVMEGLIFAESFPDNNYLNHFDANAFVNYIIVYTLTGNQEINHPKSTYIYKKKGGKYNMGPIWDFDWAFGYESGGKHFVDPTKPLFWSLSRNSVGTLFFSRIMEDPTIQKLYKEEWAKFKTQNYPILVDYIKEYADIIRESHALDQERWGKSSGSIDKYKDRLLDYLEKRVTYMDGLTGGY